MARPSRAMTWLLPPMPADVAPQQERSDPDRAIADLRSPTATPLWPGSPSTSRPPRSPRSLNRFLRHHGPRSPRGASESHATKQRWEVSLLALSSGERERLLTQLPQMENTIKQLETRRSAASCRARRRGAASAPRGRGVGPAVWAARYRLDQPGRGGLPGPDHCRRGRCLRVHLRPLIRAMLEGKVLFIDDATLISPAVLAVCCWLAPPS